MTPSNFAHLAGLIRAELHIDGTVPTKVFSGSLETILAALDLVPIALAAIAYHDRNEQPAFSDKWREWDALAGAVEQWKKSR